VSLVLATDDSPTDGDDTVPATRAATGIGDAPSNYINITHMMRNLVKKMSIDDINHKCFNVANCCIS